MPSAVRKDLEQFYFSHPTLRPEDSMISRANSAASDKGYTKSLHAINIPSIEHRLRDLEAVVKEVVRMQRIHGGLLPVIIDTEDELKES